MNNRRRSRRSGIAGGVRRLRRFRLIRVFRRDPLFAWAFGILGAVGLVALLAVPRMWKTTPDDFPGGTVRVNWIDLLQARSLARSAQRAGDRGELETALAAWRGAIANNAGDARWHRGLLAFLRTTPKPRPGLLVTAMGSIRWLLALTATNAPDASLAAQVLERYGRPEHGLSLLESVPGRATESAFVVETRARCVIAAGRSNELGPEWSALREVWEKDPPLRPYVLAWRADAAETGSEKQEAIRQLRKELDIPGETGLTAARLLLSTAARDGAWTDMEPAVERLERSEAASEVHHVELWRALARDGREDEARRRAAEYDRIPGDSEGAAVLLRALRGLGLQQRAVDVMGGHMSVYGRAVRPWREYFDCLADLGNWDEVRRAIAEARQSASPLDALHAESVFAAYRNARASGREGESLRLANELAEAQNIEPEGGLRMVAFLRQFGHTAAAATILGRLESLLDGQVAFWGEAFAVSRAQGDLDGIRRAVDALQRLDPGGQRWENARAALLLILDEDRAEALRLTFAAWSRQPNAVPLRINHAFALARNYRAREAAALLESIRPSGLSPEVSANYYLALAETSAELEEWREVVMAAAKVHRPSLLSPQLERLDRLVVQARERRVAAEAPVSEPGH